MALYPQSPIEPDLVDLAASIHPLPDMPKQVIELDSIAYNVLCEGPDGGSVVVLLHALMSNLHIWDSTVAALHRAGFRTLRYDFVGHGETPPPVQQRLYHFDDFTRHIDQMISIALPACELHGIVGCSMGGVIAIRYALMYPGKAKKIASCESPGLTSLEENKVKWRQRIKQFQSEGIEPLAKQTVDRWFPDPCDPEIRDKCHQLTKTCSLEGYIICAEGIMNYDYTDQLSDIREEKVMVLVGENDEAVGRMEVLQDVAARIDGAKYVAMPDTGHIPPMHQSKEFERILLTFMVE